jgi:NAD(P)-dependent dehydrogenase (short-subunit alcohol dehydrogenase family)
MRRDSKPLAGQVILISGAGSGIGAATAAELNRRGAVPVLVDIDLAAVQAVAVGLHPRPLALQGDVSRPADCEAAVRAALDRHGRLDIVWANAGIASFGPLLHTDPLAWRRVIDVNVLGVMHTVRAALPAVLAARGYVLVTASVASFAHPPAMSSYAASKAAVEAACNAWRIELAAHGVDVGAIHASWIRTPLVTEGSLHPAFVRLRGSSPAPLQAETSADDAAMRIADGIARRADRIWIPGWVRWLHALRALLHTRAGERALREAAPDIERLYLEGLAAEGRQASSFGPRELERARQAALSEFAASGTAASPAPPATRDAG